MALHEVQLKGYSVRPGNLSLGTFDSYGIEQLHVTADDSWDGLDILAVFHAPNGDAKKVVVGADGMLNVPPEATAKQAGNGRIVFVGLAENVQRITVDMGYNIKTHSDIEGDNPGVPTPDVVQQILQAALNAEKNSAEAKSVADGLRNDAASGKFDGKDGVKGDKGDDGTTPQLKIGEDNLWNVSYDNGATWVSFGVKATGDAGKDGVTPHIGENGNWLVGDTDTGVSAKGPKGDPGPQGPAGEIPEDYPQIREDVSQLKEDLDNLVETTTGKNLLDTSKMQNGFLQNSGVISTADWALAYSYTDKIKCTKKDIVFANATSAPSNQLGGLYKNGTWVAQLSSNSTITKVQDTDSKNYYNKIVFTDSCPEFDSIVLNTIRLSDFKKKFVMLNLGNEPFIYEQYDDYSFGKAISKQVPAQSITEELENEIINKANFETPKIINCWGDSLTVGVGATNRNTDSYPARLGKLLNDGFKINNFGVGGEGAGQIASRQGGYLGYVQPCTIPASGQVNVTVKELSSGTVLPLLAQGNAGVNPCYIRGIKGNLTRDGETLKFTRESDGDAIEIKYPVPLITDASINNRDGILIVWAGTNNKPYYNSSPTVQRNEIHNVVSCIKAIIAHSNCHGKYIVLGLTSKDYVSDIDKVNQHMDIEFGRHFLDVRQNILISGLADVGITPTDQDATDIQSGEIPTSLRVDTVHLTSDGYLLIAKYVYAHGKALGYWN